MMAKLLASLQCRAIVPAAGMTALFLPTRESVEQMQRRLGLTPARPHDSGAPYGGPECCGSLCVLRPPTGSGVASFVRYGVQIT